ncbi:HPr family phosphocarrier protein [Geosporobacter subterraneus]
MGAVEGDRIILSAEGSDEKEAVKGRVRLLESKFGEV